MMQEFQTFDGTTLAYRDEGEGLPVLCLAGLTRNTTDFDYVAPHLTDVRMVCLDYRGRGASAWADPETYTVPTEARDAVCLLDHLGIDKAALIGTSRGGLIAMTLAATVKDRLIGVCLNDIGPELIPGGLDQIREYIGKNPVAKSIEALAMARARMMQGFDNVPDSRWLEEARKHYIDTGDGITINYDPALAQIFNRPSPEFDLWPLFDAMEGLPLSLIWGENSNLLSQETTDKMRARRPDMGFAKVPDRGHIPFLDEPEALAEIRNWIARCR